MAISTAPRCEIRALVMHVYPDGIKAYGHERHTVYVGRKIYNCKDLSPSRCIFEITSP